MDLLNYDDDDDDDDDDEEGEEDDKQDDSTNRSITPVENNNHHNNKSPTSLLVGQRVASSHDPPVLMTRKRPHGGSPLTILSSEEAPINVFQRSIPHRRGHWSGHVFIPIAGYKANRSSTSSSSNSCQAMIQQSIQDFYHLLQNQHHEFTQGTIVQHSHYHISLSKYFSLPLACIDSFVQKLTQRLAGESSTRVFILQQNQSSSTSRPSEWILVNEDKTRSFWCWKVQPNPFLLRILHHVDACLKDYGQPVYYHPPQFHISIASFDGDLSSLVPIVESMRQSQAKKEMDVTTATKDKDDDNQGSNGDDDDEEEEDSDDENDDNDDDGINALDCKLVKVDRVVCNFGTTKSYTIPIGRA